MTQTDGLPLGPGDPTAVTERSVKRNKRDAGKKLTDDEFVRENGAIFLDTFESVAEKLSYDVILEYCKRVPGCNKYGKKAETMVPAIMAALAKLPGKRCPAEA